MPIVREEVLRTLAFDIFCATGIPVEDARVRRMRMRWARRKLRQRASSQLRPDGASRAL